MLPAPVDLLEGPLWDVHARLDMARADGRGVSEVDEAARKLIAEYLRGTAEHRDALRSFLRRLEAEHDYMEREQSRLARLRDEADSDRRRFRAHVLNAMKAIGTDKLRGHHSLFSIGTADPYVQVRDIRLVPDAYVNEIPAKRTLRESAALAAFRTGTPLPGVVVVEGEPRLVIR